MTPNLCLSVSSECVLLKRQVRGFPCDCAFPQQCDSQDGVLPPTRAQLALAAAQRPSNTSQPHSDAAPEAPPRPAMESAPCAEAGDGRGAGAAAFHAVCPEGAIQACVDSLQRSDADAHCLERGVDGRAEVLGDPGEAASRAFEEGHVHEVYEAIAGHFSSTRFAVWPKARLPPGCSLQNSIAISSIEIPVKVSGIIPVNVSESC